MDVIRVEGGHKLHGTVHVGGAKNSALKLMAATMMAPGVYHLSNVPNISDVGLMGQVLTMLGASVDYDETQHRLTIDTSAADKWVTPYELVSKMRASISILGPLITRFKHAVVAMPGGCNIGARSIDQHLAGLKMLGVHFDNDHGDIVADASSGLKGALVTLDFPSVGATENIMMGAITAKGTTIIENAAREPEIVDLANMLNKMGADVRDAGSHVVEIHGVDELHACDHTTVGDRIEAGTFLVAGALSADELTVEGFNPVHLDIPLRKMEYMGIRVERGENRVTVCAPEKTLVPADIQTLPFPGFPTDMQAQFMVLATQANGSSFITENVFENRFMLVADLIRMGAEIRVEDRHALVKGPVKLMGARVKSPDLRGGAALVLAGLIAEGYTLVSDTFHIKRGYEAFVEKFNAIGAVMAHIDMPD
ncbi:MAG: UDP-N-acetylglucosamine 1-carboxyvinyltransferase [Coriobacteriales bacterium]|nr:UDP-N-acetylglucosamine 1-carboxyvinyltransferase [Coriobacteriales bacterium]